VQIARIDRVYNANVQEWNTFNAVQSTTPSSKDATLNDSDAADRPGERTHACFVTSVTDQSFTPTQQQRGWICHLRLGRCASRR
jgi:hypothetical protein